MNKFNSLAIIALSCLVLSCKKEKIYQEEKQPTPPINYHVQLETALNCFVNSSTSVDTTIRGTGNFYTDKDGFIPQHFYAFGIEGDDLIDQSSHFRALYEASTFSISSTEVGNFSCTDTTSNLFFANARNLSFPGVSRTQGLTVSLAGAANSDGAYLQVSYIADGGNTYYNVSNYVQQGASSISISGQQMISEGFNFIPLNTPVLIELRFYRNREVTINGQKVNLQKYVDYQYKSVITN